MADIPTHFLELAASTHGFLLLQGAQLQVCLYKNAKLAFANLKAISIQLHGFVVWHPASTLKPNPKKDHLVVMMCRVQGYCYNAAISACEKGHCPRLQVGNARKMKEVCVCAIIIYTNRTNQKHDNDNKCCSRRHARKISNLSTAWRIPVAFLFGAMDSLKERTLPQACIRILLSTSSLSEDFLELRIPRIVTGGQWITALELFREMRPLPVGRAAAQIHQIHLRIEQLTVQ